MGNSECTYFWIGFAFVTVIMIISLVKNISYYMQEKKRGKYFLGKAYKDVPEYSPSHEEFYTEEGPVYDNLNHHQQDILNESYYEQMNAHSQTSNNEVQVAERQMCYASLDHSVKRKHKNLRKKKYPPLESEEDQLSRNCSMPSDTCIYLNSEQLSIENKVSEDSSCQ
ncbi:PREDICTED: T-cell receptor-associated transmembrane adapter 1 [Gekko japonicus]|uniref:T-cell receptor-associated transmembrane adapter 1 n=1 Tax=Gekko japonicus TaxID=146911 RepID=UPI00074FCB65|nr:PREDICTED: T-cell receptor-associated transmembrane adapter 1 [Gekko japonicus]